MAAPQSRAVLPLPGGAAAGAEAVSCPQLRPLFLLALADLLAAAAVLSTATIQLLPAPLFVPAYAACPYGLMLATVRGHLAPELTPVCSRVPGEVPAWGTASHKEKCRLFHTSPS